MDVAPCITLQSDMANLFDQYLFKDHNYEHTPPASSNLLMASQGYNSMSQFGEEDLNFQGLQLPPQQNNNNTLMATTASPSTISETDHSLADIFTSPILTSMSHQDGPEQTSSQYNDYHNPSEASYVSSQRYDTQPIYTTSELKPVLNRAQTHSQKQQQTLLNLGQPTEKLGMTSPQHLPPQPPIYQALNQGHPISTTANQIVSVTQQQRYNSADRRPSSTGSASIGSSPAESIHTSPGRESEDSDDSVPISQVNGVFPLPNGLGVKRRSPEPDDNIPSSTAKTKVAKKPKVQKKKKKRDPNEPQKPVSAYALFFRDTQAAIKGQNPNASFGEVSKIVASMWDGLDVEHKNVYKKKTEAAKKEYLKALAAYRASIVCRTGPEHDLNMNNSSMMGNRHPQTMTALQKKSPLLTSLMDNSSSNSHQQYSSAAVYSSSKLMTSTPSIEPYPTYQPPMYKPPSANMAPYHPPPNMPHNSYPHPPVNKNMMNSSMPGQNMMDMVPANSSSPVIGMDPSVPQHPHPALINMQPGTVIGSSLPQHMPTSVTSANHFNKIQGDNMSNANTHTTNSGIQPQVSSCPQTTEHQQESSTLQDLPMQELLDITCTTPPSELVIQETTDLTPPPMETNLDSIPTTTQLLESEMDHHNTPTVAQSPSHTTNSQPEVGEVSSSPQKQVCLREGCFNPVVESSEWDNEYCCSECVVLHCREVFTSWVSARQEESNLTATVK